MALPLFRDFSFGTPASQLSHEADRAAMNVSPTSILAQHPLQSPTIPPPCSIGDLTTKLSQNLHVEVEEDPSCAWPPTEVLLAGSSDDLTMSNESFQPSPPCQPYSRISTAVLRMQRQSNMRLQCSSSHVKDISKLVEKMVADEEQCSVYDASRSSLSLSPVSSRSSSTSSSEDEAIGMDYSQDHIPLHALHFRRSSDRLPGTTSITKNIRMRKKSRISKRSSK
ncbi:hypothetical protein BU24DRAFT_420691 [Aaosphaeria arxii CBS 175.79]|uniref:Uncharacterized protein n=1 Tax=Aaosphaeria arxii CBS 175.79 TaxID=1450172 RepID=A0A6A5XYC9_9PLEO|nr:uncharacterized protein BU24DRAFT_420691 [Aaosphaeria arxii CBS 175.79]KAF2017650.1 hypothetical protein BU24DRAFT_420691 [Aaosphaeria arxii CBS 175.79]